MVLRWWAGGNITAHQAPGVVLWLTLGPAHKPRGRGERPRRSTLQVPLVSFVFGTCNPGGKVDLVVDQFDT